MKKRFTEKQNIAFLGEAETGVMPIKTLCKKHNVTEQTFFHWRNKLGGMDVSGNPAPEISGIGKRTSQASGG